MGTKKNALNSMTNLGKIFFNKSLMSMCLVLTCENMHVSADDAFLVSKLNLLNWSCFVL